MLGELAPELILSILDDEALYQSDVINVSYTNKRLHQISSQVAYRSVHISKDESLHLFLRSIVRNNQIGKLVRTLHLHWVGKQDDWTKYSNVRGWGGVLIPANSACEENLNEMSSTARDLSLGDEVVQRIEQGSESAKAVLLLCSLPNLQKLSLIPPYNTGILDRHLLKISLRGLLSEQLGFVSRERWEVEGFDPSLFYPFFLLPSVHTIKGHRVLAVGLEEEDEEVDEKYDAYGEDEYEDSDVEEASESDSSINLESFQLAKLNHDSTDWLPLSQLYGTSAVHTIRFEYSKIHGDRLVDILRLPRHLKELVYSTAGIHNVECPARALAHALSYVSHSLERLAITWDNSKDSLIGSFRSFTSLKKLSIDFDLLLGFRPKRTLNMVDLLPDQLEQLFLFQPPLTWEPEDCFRIIKEFLMKKTPEILPRLEVLCTSTWPPKTMMPLLELAEEKGILLAYMKLDNFGYQPLTGLPF